MRSVLAAIALSFCTCVTGWALPWQRLHERADALTLRDAIALRQKEAPTVEDLYTVAIVFLHHHRNTDAERIFRDLGRQSPASHAIQWGTAECLRRRRDYAQAQEVFSGIIREYPDFAPAYLSLAYIHYIKMDFKETARLTLQVINLNKDTIPAADLVRAYGLYAGAKGMLAHFGGPLAKMVNGRTSLPALKKAEHLRPDAQPVLFGMGSYYLLVPKIFGRNLKAAEQYLLKAIASDPLFPEAYVRLAQVYKAQGKNGLFMTTLQKALDIDPQNEVALDIQSGACRFICVE